MKLPPANSIKLDTLTPSKLVTDATDPPIAFWDAEQLRQVLPSWARTGTLAVRDAVLKALGRMAALVWAQSSRALNAQRTARNATGAALAEIGSRKNIARAPGESEASYRARLLAAHDLISPKAVRAAVLDVSQRTGIAVYFQEPHRIGSFVCGDHTSWQTFVSGVGRWWAQDPTADVSERAGGVIMGEHALLPTLWVFIKQAVSYDAASGTVSGDVLGPTAASFVSGPVLGLPAFVTGSLSAAEQVASVLATRLAGGVNWRLYFDPPA